MKNTGNLYYLNAFLFSVLGVMNMLRGKKLFGAFDFVSSACYVLLGTVKNKELMESE